jgi:hypothetical protein
VELEALTHLPAGEMLAKVAVKAEAVGYLAAVSVKPNPTALPGMPAAEKLVDGLAAFVLLGCVAGALIGIAQWVLGSRTSNYSQADSGRNKVGAALLGAFGVGALAAIINFFLAAGSAVK